MQRLTLARNAMATRFEFVLAGSDVAQLRGAGEEALDEIERIEASLSLYRPDSEIAQINQRAGREPVRVSPEVFGLLTRAHEFYEVSGGAFDPTIGPLVRCWGFMKGSGSRPANEAITAARGQVGMRDVHLDPAESTIQFGRSGMMLDLGSIGKGYALDRAVEILRDAGVQHALLHGGTSTIAALGGGVDGEGWRLAIENPHAAEGKPSVLAVVELENESLSVSAIWGKFFELEGRTLGHVIDPRTGWPTETGLLGAVILPEAIATDALSTAVLLATVEDKEALIERVPGLRYLQVKHGPGGAPKVEARGIRLDNCLDNSPGASV